VYAYVLLYAGTPSSTSKRLANKVIKTSGKSIIQIEGILWYHTKELLDVPYGITNEEGLASPIAKTVPNSSKRRQHPWIFCG